MNKIIYFLGAGAAKAVAPNAPLNTDLVKKSIENFIETEEAINLVNFIKKLYHNRQQLTIDNQIWNLLDYIIQQRKSPSIAINLENIIDLKNDLMNLVIKEFEKEFMSVDNSTNENFIKNIESQNPTIISTNYDNLIDLALKEVDGYNYGAKIRKSVDIKNIQTFFGLNRPSLQSVSDKINSGNILLLKIHGSLNWLYCPKCDEVDITIYEKGAVKTLKDLYCINQNCTSKYENLLITPTMYKDYENRVIKEIWEHAENKLIGADELVFIGYALKEKDYQIRCLLMKAMLAKKEKYKKVTVIEREPDNNNKLQLENIKNKYEELYGTVDFKTIGFKKYVEDLK